MTNIRLIAIGFSSLLIFASFWLFSRFTVDDAFISWRYGKNLVDFGIWNYNPSLFDLTQAYTNPVFALLSILPPLFGIDVVLFFKVFSIITLVLFFVYFYKKTNSLVMTLIAYALPATFIHAFSGLETFLFVALLVVLFISMDENKPKLATIITLALFLTRPEAWLLVAIVPLFFLTRNVVDKTSHLGDLKKIPKKLISTGNYKTSLKTATAVFIALASFLSVYFFFHIAFFGYALPNTFYAKSGGGFSLPYLMMVLIVILPLLLLALKKKYTLMIFVGGFFLIIGVKYSLSSLGMNYIDRFLFQILMPIYFILVYAGSRGRQKEVSLSVKKPKLDLKVKYQSIFNVAAFLLLGFMLGHTVGISKLGKISNYYPRTLDAHAALGKTLNSLSEKDGVKSFSFGDAGMAAYHSGINAFDNIGLGSSLLTFNGISFELLDSYSPEVVVFHSRPGTGIRLGDHNQEVIKDWADYKGYMYICDIYWNKNYTLKIYSYEMHPEITKLCSQSKALNNIKDIQYFRQNLKHSPLKFWHE